MTFRKINLFLASVLIIILFFNIPAYNYWMYHKILDERVSVFYQAQHMDEEERRIIRFGDVYVSYMALKDKFKVVNDPVILFPPGKFLETNHILFTSPEPAVFYYFTGLRSVLITSPNVADAKWTVIFNSTNKMAVIKIRDKQHLDTILTFLKKYN